MGTQSAQAYAGSWRGVFVVISAMALMALIIAIFSEDHTDPSVVRVDSGTGLPLHNVRTNASSSALQRSSA